MESYANLIVTKTRLAWDTIGSSPRVPVYPIVTVQKAVLSTQLLHVQRALQNTDGETPEELFVDQFIFSAGQDAIRKSWVNNIC